jgi:hypothetical protein
MPYLRLSSGCASASTCGWSCHLLLVRNAFAGAAAHRHESERWGVDLSQLRKHLIYLAARRGRLVPCSPKEHDSLLLARHGVPAGHLRPQQKVAT